MGLGAALRDHRLPGFRALTLAGAFGALALPFSFHDFGFARADDLGVSPAPEQPPPPPPIETAPPVASTPDTPPPSLAPSVEAPEPSLAPSTADTTAAAPAIPVNDTPPPPVASTPSASDPETPAPMIDAVPASNENVVETRRSKWVPEYQRTRPAWGVSVTGSYKALGGGDISADGSGAIARAVEIQAEYQFPFLQSIGVISLGPAATLYPVTPSGTVTESPASVWAVGGQVRYQARFFREQPIVPVVGFEGQRMAYAFTDGASGSTVLKGPFFGAMFLLNLLEPSSASEFYIDHGVSRSYLLAEYKQLSGTDGTLTITAGSLFFGLRFEF